MVEKTCYIIRGISGSGKSHTARTLCLKLGGTEENNIFSTDDFWIRSIRRDMIESRLLPDYDPVFWEEISRETYRDNWKGHLLGVAHNWNFERFVTAIIEGVNPIIVDNTNIKARDMKGYIAFAEDRGYKTVIKESDSPWWQDHRHMMENKQANGTALENFARFLAGFHEGMSAKYGTKGCTHVVPLNVIRNQIRRWEPNLTPDEVMERGVFEK